VGLVAFGTALVAADWFIEPHLKALSTRPILSSLISGAIGACFAIPILGTFVERMADHNERRRYARELSQLDACLVGAYAAVAPALRPDIPSDPDWRWRSRLRMVRCVRFGSRWKLKRRLRRAQRRISKSRDSTTAFIGIAQQNGAALGLHVTRDFMSRYDHAYRTLTFQRRGLNPERPLNGKGLKDAMFVVGRGSLQIEVLTETERLDDLGRQSARLQEITDGRLSTAPFWFPDLENHVESATRAIRLMLEAENSEPYSSLKMSGVSPALALLQELQEIRKITRDRRS